MTLTKQLLHQISDPSLTNNERALLRCRLAKELEETGNYEAASEALGELWVRIGERPRLDGLDQAIAAEVLLRVGVLTGWIGSVRQIADSQELAKDLISKSLSQFESLGAKGKIAEAQMELGHCYWREGAFNEARDYLKEALSKIDDRNKNLKAITLLRLATVEKVANRPSDALNLFKEATPLFELSDSHTIKGRFHNEFAQLLRRLGKAEERDDYIDQALIEYTASSFHFEQAGHRRYQACVENNLGFLFSSIGKYDEAHNHLDRAQALFTSLKDSIHLAQVDETRARVFIAEERFGDAEKLAGAAVQVLEKGGEQSLLAEALRTQGVALARLGRLEEAGAVLGRAAEVAEQVGDLEGAGQAALTLAEELGEQLTPLELGDAFERAWELLSTSRHPGNKDRLLACARRVIFLLGAFSGPSTWRNFSFDETVRRFEARLLERALRDAGGVITQAARLLGVKRQSLSSMLHTRHKDLLQMRPPSEPRKRNLMFRGGEDPSARPVTILYAEDRREVSDTVKETFEMEGWRVEVVADGAEALERVRGEEHYDVMVFDYELPGPDGVVLTRRARRLPHRQRTPIIMLTAGDVESEARRAGVSAFLRKPDDVAALVETVAGLLARQSK